MSLGRSIVYYYFSLYIVIATNALLYDSWMEITSSPLPRPTEGTAVGYDPYNHTIWFVGGYPDQQQLVSYNYVYNTITDHGQYWLPRIVHGYGQYYAQIGTTLYFSDDSNSSIHSFNMETTVFTTDYTSPPISWDSFGASLSCFVSINNEYLAILQFDETVQILHIKTQVWLDSVPSLRIGLFATSCVYLNDKMFIVGGHFANYSSSIYYLNVSSAAMMNMASTSWILNVDSLPQPLAYSRCVAVNDDILVIGGQIDRDRFTLNTVYVINSITGNVSLGGHLVQSVTSPSVAFVNATLFSFGGTHNENSLQRLSGYQMLTLINPTRNPTFLPSIAPSRFPSYGPTASISSTRSGFNALTTSEFPAELATQPRTTVYYPSAYTTNTSIGSVTKTTTMTDSSTTNQNDIWYGRNGTMINITVTIDGSVSIQDVVNTVNNTIAHYLIAEDIKQPLQTDVIPTSGTSIFIIIFSISHQLENGEINTKDIEAKVREDLNDEYDGRVKVDSVIMNTDGSDDNDDMDNRDGLWITLGIIVSVVFVALISIVIIICISRKSTSKEEFYDASSKHISVNENATNHTNGNAIQLSIMSSPTTDVTDNGENQAVDKRAHRNALFFQHWLENVVQLPIYYDVFLNNGYETLDIVKEITSVDELEEIGIVYKEHQRRLFKEIQELKYDKEGIVARNRKVSVEGNVVMMMRTSEGE